MLLLELSVCSGAVGHDTALQAEGMQWCSWSRHCATSRRYAVVQLVTTLRYKQKVAVSIQDGFIGT